MTISTKQAGSILKVSAATIGNLVKASKLKDISGKKGRHEYLLDAKEVRAFKKIYKKRRHYQNQVSPISDSEVRINQVRNQELIRYPVMIDRPMNGIMTRLGNIETKLDLLIKMWS